MHDVTCGIPTYKTNAMLSLMSAKKVVQQTVEMPVIERPYRSCYLILMDQNFKMMRI